MGWFGFVFVLGSYLMVALQRWVVRSIPTQLGNVLGASFLGINSFYYNAWVPVFLNVVWLIIAGYTLICLLWKTPNTQ